MMIKKLFIVLLLSASCVILPAQAQDAAGIIRKMDKVVFAGRDQTSEVTLILKDRRGNERTRQATVWQKGSDMRLFRFTAPAAEAGIAFLSLPDDIMYLYMPAYGRERRIASHVKNQSFAGTDFSYEDLEVAHYGRRFSPELIEETDTHYIIELTPLPDTRSDYSRIITHINKEHYFPEKMISFDRGEQEYKVAEYTFKQHEDYWYTKEISMTNLRRNHSTRMIFEEVTFDTGLDDELFTVRNLTRF